MAQLTFGENERVLCYHGPLIYEAKVLKLHNVQDCDGNARKGAFYWVHYRGWNQSWDEWVPENRLLKYSKDNLCKQKQLNEVRRAKHASDKALARHCRSLHSRPPSHSDPKSKKPEPRPAKRSRDLGPEPARGRGLSLCSASQDYEALKRPKIQVLIPEPLKLQLVDDWEAVTRNNQVVTLPRNPSVKTLFEDYQTHALLPDATKPSINLVKEVLCGLKVYFDKSLGHSLLYRNERQQYMDIKKKPELEKTPMSEIYGAEHLLRLFVNLPELISHTTMEPEVVAIVGQHINSILGWLVLEQKRVFQSPYDVTSPAYQNINRAM